MARPEDAILADAVRSWQRQLLDLSMANPLVSIGRSPQADAVVAADPAALPPTFGRTLRVASPDAATLFAQLVHRARAATVDLAPASSAPRDGHLHFVDAAGQPVERKLTHLRRSADTAQSEQGIQTLYVAFGLLRWRDAKMAGDGWRFAPLLLAPVTIERVAASGRSAHRVVPTGDGPYLNHTIRARIAELKIHLPDLDESDTVDLATTLAATRDAVAALPGWAVLEVAELGLFHYHRLPMHDELGRNAHRVAGHALVRTLAGVGHVRGLRATDLPGVAQLDHAIPAAAAFPLLDADASQRRAIAAAVAGIDRAPGDGSIVIQGPPGTGKSQTIANIIAEHLARGKSVLFVSEKLAALEVVARRLRDAGLGDHLLELHSHKANRYAFLQQLRRSLEALEAAGRPVPRADEAADRLDAAVAALAADAAALATPRQPLGRAPYDVIGALAAIPAAARAHWLTAPMPASAGLTWAGIDERCALAARLAALTPALGDADAHPWRHYKQPTLPITLRNDIEARLPRLAREIRTVLDAATLSASALGLPAPRSTADLELLREIANATSYPTAVDPSWFAPGVVDALQARARDLHQSAGRRAELIAAVGADSPDADLSSRLLALDPDALEAALFPPIQRQRSVTDPETQLSTMLAQRDSLLTHTAALAAAAADCQAAVVIAATSAGIAAPGSIADCTDLLDFLAIVATGPAAPAGWLSHAGIATARARIADASARQTEYRERLAAIHATGYTPRLVDVVTPELVARNAEKSAFGALSRQRRADNDLLEGCRRAGEKPGHEATIAALAAATRARSLRDWAANQAREIAADTGIPGTLDTDWDGVLARIAPIEVALRLAGPIPSPTALDHLQASTPDEHAVAARARLVAAIAGLRAAWAAFAVALPRIATTVRLVADVDTAPLATIVERTDALARGVATALATFDQLREVFPRTITITPSSLRALLARLRDLRDLDLFLASDVAARFGPLYTGPATNWQHVDGVLAGIARVRDLFPTGGAPPAVIALVCDTTGERRAAAGLATLPRLSAHLDRELEWLRGIVDTSRIAPAAGHPGAIDLAAIATFCEERALQLGDLERIVESRQLEQRARALEALAAIQALRLQRVPPDLWADAMRANLLLRWLSDAIEATPALRTWDPDRHEREVAEFRAADVAHMALTAARVRNGVAGRYDHRRPLITHAETTLLHHELGKKAGHLSPKALIGRLPHLFPAVAPCLMMSPLSVATFLPDDLEQFDVVIFDEASQVRPHDAIGAILRGRQAIVVGDDRQLPPSNAMQKAFSADGLDEDDGLDLLLGQESLLGALAVTAFGGHGGLASFTLSWHYRSRDERLIAFSNDRFYGGALITLPAASATDGASLVFDHCPDGRFHHQGEASSAPRGQGPRPGTNPVEAARIVDHVREHARQRPDRSLGVVTLNQPQADLVADLVEEAALGDRHVASFLGEPGRDPFFVKALEQVQGDERDVMILGIGFSREESGRIKLLFGPIGHAGGERRLNVAITRARHRLVVVSSLLGAELRQRLEQSRGGLEATTYHTLGYLADFLDYARDGRPIARNQQGIAEPGDPFPAAVAAWLREQGYVVSERVGASSHALDLAIVDPANAGRFLLGIDIDGSVAVRAPTARDRERIRPDQLAALGWRTHRVSALGWEKSPARERERLRQVVAAALATTRPPA